MDAVKSLLRKYGWAEEAPIDTKEKRDLLVHSYKNQAVAVIGPLWTTYYLRPLVEHEIDSVKTDDLPAVERVIKRLTKKVA